MGGVTAGLDDAQLRDRIAEATAGYFLDWSHPVSGMARERSAGAFGYDVEETVTTGGTGFGIMAQIVAAERGWRKRQEILDRLERLTGFLETADRFNGVYAHFYYGSTGRVIPFMAGDDGGDIVETSFLAIGLLAAAEYFSDAPELALRMEAIVRGIDWSAHVGPKGVMWHAHPDRPFPEKALDLGGWNEAFPVFVLGAGAEDESRRIPANIYHDRWAKARSFLNGRSFEGIPLPLGPDWGGPLFLSQYPFLGIDPRGLKDAYADYGVLARNHALINRAHCLKNPHGWKGYGPDLWGLTAGDDHSGYVAHSPKSDTGVITPTAVLTSFPMVPEEAMPVIRHLHDDLGDRIFGEAGFVDGFSLHHGWMAESRLAIDQGPIVAGLENHRSGLLWTLVMKRPEIRRGLAALGFSSPYLSPSA